MLELASGFVKGFEVHGFIPALIGALLLGLVNSILQAIFVPKRS
jgi:uncharacterized membrane protein YvlD (DUF360 family)